jgi:uncharacterized protein (TIGR00369 family)
VTGYGELSQEDRDRLREAFQNIALHKLLDLRPVRLAPELVVYEMPVREEAFNPTGNLHGGALATLIDVSAGTAAALNSSFVAGENSIVTADMHIRYLGRPAGDMVRAESRVLRAGKQLVVVECHVLDTEDRLICSADFSSMVVPLRKALRDTPFSDARNPDL